MAFTDMLGAPYSRGARGPEAYDCWGVVVEAASRMGIELPDWDSTDWKSGDHTKTFEAERSSRTWSIVAPEAVVPGDVGICRMAESMTCHACLYIGGGYVIHCEHASGVLIDQREVFLDRYERTTWARRHK